MPLPNGSRLSCGRLPSRRKLPVTCREVMPAWIVQWYGNEPAAGNTCTNIWPEGKPVLNDVPSSEVTVWEKLPLFCQHTDCPCIMVAVLGENTLESVALTFADAPLLPHELAGAVELPPQAVVTTSAIPRASMVRMRSLLGRSERCMREDISRLGPVTNLQGAYPETGPGRFREIGAACDRRHADSRVIAQRRCVARAERTLRPSRPSGSWRGVSFGALRLLGQAEA